MQMKECKMPNNTGSVTVLGLESSCDETAAAIVRLHDNGQVEILSDCIFSQVEQHEPFGGVVPEIAARAHADIMDKLVLRALNKANLGLSDLDGVAATSGPGLIGGVLVGMMTAKALAIGADMPFLGINHLEGHALSPRLASPLDFPYLLLLVSGGHTQLLAIEALGKYHRYGSTIDDAVGEAFDKTAKIMGLGFPGGPAVEKIARTGDASRFDLPRPLQKRKGCDFSFAGLKSAVQRHWQNVCDPCEQAKADLAASFQRAASETLSRQTAKALVRFATEFTKTNLVVAGGVAANQTIRDDLQNLAKDHGFGFIAPPLRFCTDNGAMIALAGAEHLAIGRSSPLDLAARPRWPLDESAALNNPASGSGKKGPKS
ncbi:MAG: tRNA (adenosine(37)-N6)-threonylcarbamoyltransferase complex transferase subunit TsaD [Robiginitomaculum sp.]|nr:tRNA (adenosine(37)-N6)-threonylcarbamoyltransferase complex transferase subunit TsaD [Robiginitomaculum sp.]